jgi:hypothetical protein
MMFHHQLFLCVITYQYDDRTVEIPNSPTSLVDALWQLDSNWRLNSESEHIQSARVFSEQDYRMHLMRRVAEAVLVS